MQIFIGGESGGVTLDEFSMVTAPYEVDGKIVGTVAVIGPTRMAYERGGSDDGLPGCFPARYRNISHFITHW